MSFYKTQLKNKEEVAEGTMAFFFEKPTGFEYKAGQHISITIPNPPETDNEGNTRIFSLASAPYKEDLMIATRMRDTAFKRTLKNMEIGTEVHIDGPSGIFYLHEDSTVPAVFLAGGIGITPFLSIATQAGHDQLSHRIYLFYSNRRPEDSAFLEELSDQEGINRNFKLVGTMTEIEKSNFPWLGEKGYIDSNMLKNHLDDLARPVYYIAGPPAMTTSMREMLSRAGVPPENIRFENFFGY